MPRKRLRDWFKGGKDRLPKLKGNLIHTENHGCTKWVLLESKFYGNQNYRGAVLVESKNLISWALEIQTGVKFFSSSVDQAKINLYAWLCNADSIDETITILDQDLYSVLKHYVDNFIRMNLVHCYCQECKALHDRVIIKEFDIMGSSDQGQWNEIWCCPNHHIIYEEIQSVRIF